MRETTYNVIQFICCKIRMNTQYCKPEFQKMYEI